MSGEGIGIGVGEGEALANEVALGFQDLADALGLDVVPSGSTITGAPTAGEQIIVGSPKLATPNTNIFSGITDFFSNLFSPSSSPIGTISETAIDTTPVPRTVTSTPINPNILIGGIAAGTAAVGATIIATNPGAQQTAQTFASGFSSFGKATQQATSFLTSSPYGPILLIGGLVLLGVVIFKK